MLHSKKTLFYTLEEQEQKEFVSKLIHAIGKDNQAYYDAVKIVSAAESKNNFDDVKFFNKNIHGK